MRNLYLSMYNRKTTLVAVSLSTSRCHTKRKSETTNHFICRVSQSEVSPISWYDHILLRNIFIMLYKALSSVYIDLNIYEIRYSVSLFEMMYLYQCSCPIVYLSIKPNLDHFLICHFWIVCYTVGSSPSLCVV